MSENKEYTLAQIANHTDSVVIGDSMAIVNNLSTLENASSDSLSFLSNPKYSKFISASKAQAIIIHDSFKIKDNRNIVFSKVVVVTSKIKTVGIIFSIKGIV